MFGRAFASAVLASSLAFVPGAAAQRVPDWHQSHLLENAPPVSILYRVATCLAVRHPDEMRALLDSPPGSPEEAAAFAALMPDPEEGCLASTRRLTRYPRSLLREVQLMRGALAEARLRTAGDSRERLPPPSPAASAEQEPDAPLDLARAVALCAAGRHPATVYTLINHNPGSPGEHRELRNLAAEFERCLPEGRALEVDRLTIRAFLAESLYRLMEEPAPGETATP